VKREKQRAEAKNKQGSGKAFPKDCDWENQAAESLCKPHTHQEISKEEEVPQDRVTGS